MVRPKRPASFSSRAAKFTAGPMQVKSSRLPLPILPNSTSPTCSDPVGDGFVASMARPGGNATGFTNIEASLGGKWVELLKEINPRITRVAAMFNPKTAASSWRVSRSCPCPQLIKAMTSVRSSIDLTEYDVERANDRRHIGQHVPTRQEIHR